MLVAELIGQREFRLTEQPIEPPGPGEVQVRVGAVGICGSDVHSYAEGAIGDTPCVYPMVLGHEPAGTVVRTGDGRDRLVGGRSRRARAGDLLLSLRVLPRRPAQHLREYPIPQQSRTPGLLSRVREPAGDEPAGASAARSRWNSGPIVEPLAVAMHSLKFAAIGPGDTVAVFGAGPIGLLTIASLKVAGRRPHLGGRAGGAPARDGEADGRGRGARPESGRRVAADHGRHRRARRRLRDRLRGQGAHAQLGAAAWCGTAAGWC